MASQLRMLLLSLVFSLFVSCGLLSWNECTEYNHYSDKIQFDEYNSGKYYSKDSLLYNMYQFNFYKDSSFSYLRIWHQKSVKDDVIKDTVMALNGKFKIYKDSGMPWYVLKLEADSIYKKEIKDTIDGILHFTTFANSKFEGFGDSLFTNPDRNWGTDRTRADRCFYLYTKYDSRCQNGWGEPCNYKKSGTYWNIQFSKEFCLEPPKEPQTNSTGDKP